MRRMAEPYMLTRHASHMRVLAGRYSKLQLQRLQLSIQVRLHALSLAQQMNLSICAAIYRHSPRALQCIAMARSTYLHLVRHALPSHKSGISLAHCSP